MRIAIAADHAGYALKEILRRSLSDPIYNVEDLGTHSDVPVDYPDFAAAVASRILAGACDRGILVCGTGLGMAMAANRWPGIRAAAVWDEETVRLARQHNDANVLALGARVLPVDLAISLVRTFLTTPFVGGRHQDRLARLELLTRQPGALSR